MIAVWVALTGRGRERDGITVDGVHNQLAGQPPAATGGSWWPPRSSG